MAVAHVGTDSTGDIASVAATTTITKPTGVTLDATHVLIAVFGTDNAVPTTTTVNAPAGWTRVGTTQLGSSGSNRIKLDAFWALGNVAALGFTNSNTGASYQQGWVCAAFGGCDTTTAIDAAGTSNTANGAATITANAVTIATNQSLHLIAACEWINGTFSAPSFTPSENAGANAGIALLYNATPKSVGSTGTVVVTNSATATGQILCAQPFALRPAAGVAASQPPAPTTIPAALLTM